MEHVECIPDITNDEYCFSDGCGEISSDYANEIAEKLGLEETPSLFQVKLKFK